MIKKIFKHKVKLLYLDIGIFKCRLRVKFWRSIAWILQQIIFFRNRMKRLYYKMTTYNTDEIWRTCGKKCQSWPGNKDYLPGFCGECEMWNKLSPKVKLQLNKECMAYAHHCMTGD
jgi:hypothetical protein